MADRRFVVLLNDALKGHVLALGDKERRRLREKFEFLENGLWDSGVRVKKLRGTSKLVFEARLSKADRLLFTLGNHRGSVAIYVWGLVAHDDISAAAARVVPANAPFLSFEELEPEDHKELVLDSLPESYLTQEDVEEKVPEDHGPQRWLVLDETEWQRLLARPDPSSYEAFLFLTREQEDLLAATPPVLLSGTAGSGKTTLSVYYLLRGQARGSRRLFLTYNPLLKKLAERIFAGLVEKRGDGAPGNETRFAVFRELLREIAGDGASDGAVNRAGGAGPSTVTHPGDGKGRFPPEREVALREFAEIFADHRDRKRYDAELVWEEIRSIIKGAKLPLDPSRCAALVERFVGRTASAAERRELREYLVGLSDLGVLKKIESFLQRRTPFSDWEDFLSSLDEEDAERADPRDETLRRLVDMVAAAASNLSRPLLSLDEYLAIGRKRAPAFRQDRAAIHSIATFYQDRLERSGRWDEIDLTRAALRRLDGGQLEFAWDLVVCDEVQDLTDVQISFVFRLAATPRGVVLTGDPRQILNPTGFRWEEVKYRFRERGLPVPEVRRLSLNFRCAGPIVRLANALLDLKQSLVGLADTEMREDWKFGGRPPVLLEGMSESKLRELLGRRAAGQVILTRAAEEALRLRASLGTELVFTIAEAKGLEFETVMLWRYCADAGAEAIWREIASGERPSEDRLPHVRHELALLYVAVTRARGGLLVWDGQKPSGIWDIGSLAEHVFRTQEQEPLERLWKAASSPKEWEAQGDYLLERGQISAARECFRNAGAEGKLALAEAMLLEHEGRFAEAAPLFERQRMPERAAPCYERAGAWEAAQRMWTGLGERDRATRCAIHLAEERGEWAKAAEAWAGLGEDELARKAWQKAGAFDRLGAAAMEAGEFEKAASLFERARKPREAAEAWQRAGQLDRAADLYLRAGEYRLAAKLFKTLGDDEKLLRCLRQIGDHRGVALLLEKRGEIEKAIEALEAHVSQSAENRARLAAEVPQAKTRRTALKAAVRLAALGRDAEAAPLFLQASRPKEAAKCFGKSGDSIGLSRSLEALGKWREAAQAIERSDMEPHKRANESQRLLYEHLMEAEEKGTVDRVVAALHEEAVRMLASGDAVSAVARLRLIRDDDRGIEAFKALGWHEEAIDFFLGAGQLNAALRYVKSAAIAVSAGFVDHVRSRYLRDHRFQERHDDLRELLMRLVAAAVGQVPPAEQGRYVDRTFTSVFGGYLMIKQLSEEAVELLLRSRAYDTIVGLLETARIYERKPSKSTAAFLARLAARAKETEDARLAACHAWATDSKAFEGLAAGLALGEDTAVLLGRSRSRYREAVDFLMAAGRVEEAERCCRVMDDNALAGSWAEKRQDFRSAARYFMEAKDYAAALRCFRKIRDRRGEARALERLGRIDEAIALFRRLGKKRDVERLMKKRSTFRASGGEAAPGLSPHRSPREDSGQGELFD